MTEAPMPDSALVAVREGVLLQHVVDETVLLQLDSGTYFTLDAVGTRMLDLACKLSDAAAVVDVLEREYDAPRDVLAGDLEGLLVDLEEKALVDRRP